MCTVTYIPLSDGFILTSSRDEQVFRPTSKPKVYEHNKVKLIYPKDEVASGTWIAASNNNKVACLLNGAFTGHFKEGNYQKSRGLILLDFFEYTTFTDAIESIELSKIEPFTLLLIDYKHNIVFHQLVWDGANKYIEKVNHNMPQIWSSSTLYSTHARALRKTWFDNWIIANKHQTDRDILNFHTTKHGDIESNDIIMKGENNLQTVSISQLKIAASNHSFFYFDLKDLSNILINLSEIK